MFVTDLCKEGNPENDPLENDLLTRSSVITLVTIKIIVKLIVAYNVFTCKVSYCWGFAYDSMIANKPFSLFSCSNPDSGRLRCVHPSASWLVMLLSTPMMVFNSTSCC
jgi:hypothetical protein